MVARLNTVLQPNRITSMTTQYLVETKRWPNGQMSSRLRSSQPIRNFEIEFDGINLSQYQALYNHYASAKGKHLPFEFQDSHDGTVYIVRYASDLKRDPVKPNVKGLYKIKVKLEEDI